MKRREFAKNIALASVAPSTSSLLMSWGNYWLGGDWALTSYMVLRGLTAYGKDDLSKSITKKTCKNVAIVFEATWTFWEKLCVRFGILWYARKKRFLWWTALFPIAMYNEYLKEM